MRTNSWLRVAVSAALMASAFAHADIVAPERATLDALYTQTHGESWTVNTGWEGPAGTECTWEGITCSDTGVRIAAIRLSNHNLRGSLPDLSALILLQVFDVQGNQLSGPVQSLATLGHLQEFLVGNNNLSGPVPIPPDGDEMRTGGSSLCPNHFIPASNPETPVDRFWDEATDNDPWSEGCTAAVAATATAIPTLGSISLFAMIGVLFTAAALAVRRRAK